MNKRIKELLSQAGVHYEVMPKDTVYEKFAELIVKECAYLVNDYQRTKGYTNHAEMLCEKFGIEFKEQDYYGVD